MSVTKVTDAMRNVTAVDATKISGAVPSASLTNVDLSTLEYNQAILAFKVASANQLAKFSMVDQVIDEYQDATGIDAGASTNELASGATSAKYFEGGVSITPTTSSVGSVASTGTVHGDYTYYKWTTVASDHTFTTDTAQDYEYLVVAGGGGGGKKGGGGGAGGFRTATGFAVAATTITGITVGAGGAGTSNINLRGTSGNNSVFSTITSTGGGGGGSDGTYKDGSDGGSGGGNAGGGYTRPVATGSGNTPSTDPSQGNDGGVAIDGSPYVGGGGGGASAVGADAGNGGAGTASSYSGSSVTYSGGGGGGGDSGNGTGGAGGGGAGGNGSGASVAGTANTGGGGGAGGNAGNGSSGGSGIVIIRRLTSPLGSGGNLTLQSVATTAESAPTTADLVMLIEDNEGTATINTDIKAKVSRDGSAFSGYVTLVDEGDWGTDKRILVARNIDISGIASGVAMKYKIETLNQSAGSKETRIHATSLAWA